ncbi:MAG: autotransporter-associated beta strand repeat-containing protein [Planctomycetota bacterium]
MLSRSTLCCAVVVALVVCPARHADALNFTWTNSGPGSNWDAQSGFPSFTTNWSSGGITDQIPDTNDSVVLNSAITGPISVNLNGTRRVIEATLQGPSPITLSGSTLELGNGDLNAIIGGGFNYTVASDVRMLATGDWAVSGGPGSLVVSGVVQGTPPLMKTGLGTLVLSNNNTFTGTTTVSGGTLRIGGGGSTGSIAGNLVSNATTVFNRTSSHTFNNSISGSGTLVKEQSNTLTLTANNSFNGTTTISAGTLQLGIGGTSGAINGDIVNHGQLRINRSNNYLFSGEISGTGTLQKSGTGTLTLTGSNTFTGGTTVSTGELRIGSGGTSGSIAGNVSNFSELAFNRSDDTTYSGNIGGAGNVTKLGGGTLQFTGNHSYTGTTTVSNGTLHVLDSGAIGSGDAIIDSGELLFAEDTEFGVPWNNLPNAVTVEAGGSLATESNIDISLGPVADLQLNGGSVNTRRLHSLAGSVITGQGAINAQVLGDTASEIRTTGDLAIGDATAVNGFYSNGFLDVSSGTTTLNDANTAIFDSAALVTLAALTTLAAPNGLTLDFGANVTGQGTIDTPNSDTTPLVNNGAITGDVGNPVTLTGYVKGVGVCDNCNITGTDSPGFSPAAVNRGSVAYNGTLEIEVSGTSPGSEHDQLNHVVGAGVADLGGELKVTLLDGFTPSSGESFEILTATNVVDTFVTEILPALGGGLGLELVYSPTAVSLVVVGIEGDYNGDGVVDAADYTVWRDSLGMIGVGLAADGDQDGEIDLDDYSVWVTKFGQVASAAVSVSPPEPASLLLSTKACLTLSTQRRRLR